MTPVKVFISYSWDTEEHRVRVLELANALREAGVDAEIDQYYPHNALPWPRWCEQQIEAAQFVLMICTPVYREKIEKPEKNPKEGQGVCWEADYIYNELFRNKGQNTKYLPVLLEPNDRESIPGRLSGFSEYKLQRPYGRCEGFQKLLDRLEGINRAPKPPLGMPVDAKGLPPAALGSPPPLPSTGKKSRRLMALVTLFLVLSLFGALLYGAPQHWQRLTTLPSDAWSDGEAYWAYAEGVFDLSSARSLRLTFDGEQAGGKFLLRLLPEGEDAKQPVGVKWEVLRIPSRGVVTVPLKAEDFGLTQAQLKQLKQIAVLSGSKAWNRPMGQSAAKQAVFQEMEVLSGKRGSWNLGQLVGSSAGVLKGEAWGYGQSTYHIYLIPPKVLWESTSPSTSSRGEPPKVAPSPAALPEPVPKEPPGLYLRMKDEDELEDDLKTKTIVHLSSRQTWTNGSAYLVYADGPFDLSEAKSLQIHFEPGQTGTWFWLRLLPAGEDASRPVGVRWERLRVPADGVVKVPLKPEDFGLTQAHMGKLTQISIHSGSHAWNRPLGQSASARASFRKIEALVP